jgi:DNA-nicking Smr family endonuclease
MSRKPPDFELWTELRKSLKPLRRAKAQPKSSRAAVMSPPHSPARPAPAHVPQPRHDAKSPPPIVAFDRRTAQKMTRGNVEIERRLDLHGTGIEMARVVLFQFLRKASADNVRTVLVITGKGESPYARHTLHGSTHFHAPERQGRLRRLVPEWLHEADFRELVSGFQPAHPRHGGGGAYYLRIRRRR